MKKMLKLIVLVALNSVLSACNSTSNQNTPSQQAYHQPSSDWQSSLSEFTSDVIRNHPALRNARVQIVQQESTGWAIYSAAISSLSEQLIDSASEVDWYIEESAIGTNCKLAPDYYLVLDTSGDMSLALLDGQTRSALSPEISYTFTNTGAGKLKSLSAMNVEMENVLKDVYNYNQAFEAGQDLAKQIACEYQLSKLSDHVFNVVTRDSVLNPIVNSVTSSLVKFESIVVANAQNANSEINLAIYPQNDKHLVLKGIVLDKMGHVIESLSPQVLLNKISWEAQMQTVAVDNSEQLIEHFFAVAPANYQDCDLVNPWQFGEQILPDEVMLPHFGCFALKMSLKERANTLLLNKTAEGDVYKLAPTQCHAAIGREASEYPMGYARKQLVLELNNVSGTEEVVFIASQYAWSAKLEAILDTLPDACGTSGNGAAWSNILSILEADKVDYQVLKIQH
jgi:hypothetical protein